MTRPQIIAALEPLGIRRYDIIECARNRLRGRAYPRGSNGRVAYWSFARPVEGATLRQYRAAYALARAALA